jgi:hypothetical protein
MEDRDPSGPGSTPGDAEQRIEQGRHSASVGGLGDDRACQERLVEGLMSPREEGQRLLRLNRKAGASPGLMQQRVVAQDRAELLGALVTGIPASPRVRSRPVAAGQHDPHRSRQSLSHILLRRLSGNFASVRSRARGRAREVPRRTSDQSLISYRRKATVVVVVEAPACRDRLAMRLKARTEDALQPGTGTPLSEDAEHPISAGGRPGSTTQTSGRSLRRLPDPRRLVPYRRSPDATGFPQADRLT